MQKWTVDHTMWVWLLTAPVRTPPPTTAPVMGPTAATKTLTQLKRDFRGKLRYSSVSATFTMTYAHPFGFHIHWYSSKCNSKAPLPAFSYSWVKWPMLWPHLSSGQSLHLRSQAILLTPLFAFSFQSDRNNTNNWLCRYGKRKTWHLLGTILVTLSFPLIFNKCIACQNAPEIGQIVYYGVFIVLFQFGWVSSLSLS